MSEDLRKLRALLDTAIDNILDVCEQRKQEFPRLDSLAEPTELSPAGIRNDPIIAEAIVLGVSAAAQLIATLQASATSINAWNGKIWRLTLFFGQDDRILIELRRHWYPQTSML